MTIGLIGKKCGMTRIFQEDGTSIPVTVIEVMPNRVTQIKNQGSDGYCALQVTAGARKTSHVNKPQAGHFAKANVEAGCGLWEFRTQEAEQADIQLGHELNVSLLREGQWVDVTGVTKGKGFAGTVKRHHFSTQDATHGNSLSHRAPGSNGQCQDPGRVFKGKKMAGQLGNVRRTIQNQKIVRVDVDNHLLLIKGVVPGAKGADVVVRPAIKKAAPQMSEGQ